MNKRNLLVAVLALAAFISSAAESAPQKMETRYYRLPKAHICDEGEVQLEKIAQKDSELRSFLEKAGITFPEGSMLGLEPFGRGYIMKNTLQNHARLARMHTGDQDGLKNIEVDFSIVVFAPSDIEAVARKTNSAAPSSADMIQLWKSGKGKLEAAQKLKAQSGTAVTTSSAEEIIYPTEYEQTQPSGASTIDLSAVTPGSFETREAGLHVDMTATKGQDDGAFELVIASEFTPSDGVMADDTIRYGTAKGPKEMHLPHPRFHHNKTSTTISIRDGETHVMGGLANRANDGWRYFFITLHLLDAPGGKPGETNDGILLDDGSAPPTK